MLATAAAIFPSDLNNMEDVEMVSNDENNERKNMSWTEMKKATMTEEQFRKYITNKYRRNRNRAERKEKTRNIDYLKSVDNGLHWRLQNLENEKEKLLNEGKQRLDRYRAQQATRNVVVAAPRGTKRVQEENVNVSCSKRCKEQLEGGLATDPLAEYDKAKSRLDVLFQFCESKLSKCTSQELESFSKDAEETRLALMTLTRKAAEVLLHSKILKNEESALRDIVAGYRTRYTNLKAELDLKRSRPLLPTDVMCWLSGFESQLKVIEQPLASKDFDVVVATCEKLIVEIEAKASNFQEVDIHMSLESEELTARYQTIVRKLHNKKKEYLY